MEILQNIYLWAALFGWFSAQMIKIVISIIRDRYFSLKMLFSSGGMPSSHSASACALAASIGVTQGLATPIFAMAALFSYIVMYDAAGVRNETGKQAKLLNKISSDLSVGKTKYLDRDLKELIGHTPLQVLAGAVLGTMIGTLLPFLWCHVLGLPL